MPLLSSWYMRDWIGGAMSMSFMTSARSQMIQYITPIGEIGPIRWLRLRPWKHLLHIHFNEPNSFHGILGLMSFELDKRLEMASFERFKRSSWCCEGLGRWKMMAYGLLKAVLGLK